MLTKAEVAKLLKPALITKVIDLQATIIGLNSIITGYRVAGVNLAATPSKPGASQDPTKSVSFGSYKECANYVTHHRKAGTKLKMKKSVVVGQWVALPA